MLALALSAHAARPKPKSKPTPAKGSIYGAVHALGASMRGRAVRVEVSTQFPLLGSAPDAQSLPVGGDGRFSSGELRSGTYWVVAYIDDDGDGKRTPGEICGFPRIVPVDVGPTHPRFRVTIDLDPVHAILATRFRRGPASSRLELAFVAVFVRDPKTGRSLEDAVVNLTEDGKTRELGFDPSFPGGAFVDVGHGRPPGERFVFTVSHQALGRTPRRVVLHTRSLGTEPALVQPAGTKVPAAEDLSVAWTQPQWANFAVVELYEPDPLSGLRRLFPEAVAHAVTASSPALVQQRLLVQGHRVTLQLHAGRADVRAENGEIWAMAATSREITVGPARPGAPKPAASGPSRKTAPERPLPRPDGKPR
jgi:hypothetical protein